jgi:TRAP-type C4-dicarboxylate transport system permease small subunit
MMLRFAKGVARAALAVMMLLAATDVLLRKFGGHAILGSAEITELLLVVVVFGGLAPCEAEEGHVRINFALKAAPPRLRSVLDAVTQLLSGLLFAAMTWALFRRAAGLRQWGEVTLDLGLPLYPFAAIAAAGCALTAKVLLRKSWTAFRGLRNP